MSDDSFDFVMCEEEESVEEEEIEESGDYFRTRQIQELEKLQNVLDETNIIRAKLIALQTQVAPVETVTESTNEQYQGERVITPEEAEQLRTNLEKTLTEYRASTNQAGKLNQELDKAYTKLSDLKMRMRLTQDERITRQNVASSTGIVGFRAKTQRCQESWESERMRLQKAIQALRTVRDTSIADIKEFEEQKKTNNKGIQHLSSSITIAKEDIKDFAEQRQNIEPLLKEFECVQEKHQESELMVVELSDQLDNLRNQVETSSLTANVRRELDSGNKAIADLNRAIDQVQCKTTSTLESIKDMKARVKEMERRCTKAVEDTKEIMTIIAKLRKQRTEIKDSLKRCIEAGESAGGENIGIARDIENGLGFEPESPWTVRKQMLSLKEDLQQLDWIEEQKIEYESSLECTNIAPVYLPQRKRVPMIPLKKK